MKKLKLFLENFLIYGFGGIVSKIIPLIMVPIVTRLMPDPSYYGISDLQNTLISFGSALAILGMYDAMYRMFFEREEQEYKKEICATSLGFTFIMSVGVALIMVLLKGPLSSLFFKDKNLSWLVSLAAVTTLVSSTNSLVSAPTRMQNQRKTYVLMNALGPLLSYGISIPLLLSGHYIIALPLAALISGAFSEGVFWILNRSWFSIKKFKKEHLRPLLKIAIPLFPIFIVYWIFNSSDRLMITQILGTSETGLYSVGSKLGHASQLIYMAFAGGWQYFAFSTMREDDQVGSNSKVFEYLGVISFSATAFICALARPIYTLLFTAEYASSYIISPYLFLAPLLLMLYQVGANQFLVIKKTWPNLLILAGGAVCNIIMNFVLIPRIGIEGAAIATLAGYIISDVVCAIVLIKMKLMVLSTEFIFSSALMLIFFIIWRVITLSSSAITILTAVIFSCLWAFMYRKALRTLFSALKDGKHQRESL